MTVELLLKNDNIVKGEANFIVVGEQTASPFIV